MLSALKCIIAEGDALQRKSLGTFLTSHGAAVMATEENIQSLPELLSLHAPGVVMVGLDPNPMETMRALGNVIQQHPGIAFFVMSSVVDANLLMEAIRLGVKEFVPLPLDETNLLASLGRVSKAVATNRPKARIIQFISVNGGCGSTTLACNVASALAEKGSKTLLIDLDLVRGCVAAAFDLAPRFSIADLMDTNTPLDAQLMESAVATHPATGLAILARPEVPEDAAKVTLRGITRLMSSVEVLFDYIVVDSMVGGDLLFTQVAKLANAIVLAMQLSVPCVRNTQRMMGMLRREGVPDDKLHVVVNRHTRRGNDIDAAEVEETLGVKIAMAVPNDFRCAMAAMNYGEPSILKFPRSDMSDSLKKLSHVLNGRKTETGTLQKV